MFASFLSLLLSTGYAMPQPAKTCGSTPMSNDKPKKAGWYKVQEHQAKVHNTPSSSGTVLGTLPLSTNVRIGACQEPQSMATEEGCWHPVLEIIGHGQTASTAPASRPNSTAKYLFSGVLADCFLSADLDQDQVDEQVFLSHNQIGISDPNGTSPIIWHTEANEEASVYAVSIIPAQESGVPLISFDTSAEACGVTDFNYFYLYSNTPKQQLHKVISTRSFSDYPAYVNESIEWKSDKTLVLTEAAPNRTTQQKYCLESFTYKPCTKQKNKR